jgi:tRNA pseudouridine38-40 synthase
LPDASAGLVRYRAIVAYDGTAYLGWQSQAGKRTLQDTVEHALGVVLRETVRVAAAGRTDAGVHARGQVIAFDVREGALDPTDASRLGRTLRSINGVLPSDVAFLELRPAAAGFDPRAEAVLRAYRYRIWNAPVRSPFELRYAWHVREPLETRAMEEAAGGLAGEHDFASFQGADNVPRPSVRRVMRSVVKRDLDLLCYEVEANSFARHMVRNIVGALVEVGRGNLSPAAIASLLSARDRRSAPPPAPPNGLCLEWVRYA